MKRDRTKPEIEDLEKTLAHAESAEGREVLLQYISKEDLDGSIRSMRLQLALAKSETPQKALGLK